jgi:conjugative transfer signal peptidase TraF
MRKSVLWIAGIGIALVLFGSFFDPEDRLIWNRTGSAPLGLYWLSSEPITKGQWVAVSAKSASANWAQSHGYVGPNWPLLKQIAGVPGDVICRNGQAILLNGEGKASAHLFDSTGRKLPDWEGCFRLSDEQVFLLNAHPESLDGRYFGLTNINDLDGVAIPLFTFNN